MFAVKLCTGGSFLEHRRDKQQQHQNFCQTTQKSIRISVDFIVEKIQKSEISNKLLLL